MKNKRATKDLMVCNDYNILELNESSIKFSLKYPHYLKSAQMEASELLQKLKIQNLGGDIKIYGLRLVWEEDIIDNNITMEVVE
jgi:hypothetical protein